MKPAGLTSTGGAGGGAGGAPESPIHGWDKALVRQSLSNYAAGAATAPDTDSNSYPLTLVDFKPWILQEVAVPCLRSCAEKGIFLQGLSGVGKTPLATCMGIAISGHFLNEAEREEVLPVMRSAQHIDNFRAEAGTKYRPVIYDDSNLESNSAADVKSFIDASTAVIIWERLGGVKLAANQARIMCADPINKDAGREDLPFFTREVSHDNFVNITGVVWGPTMQPEDLMAILKRCTCVVFAPRRAYIRPGEVAPVTVILYPDVAPEMNPDFIKDTSKDKLAKWKSGDQTLPVDHAHNLAWSIKFVQKCVLGESISELTPAMPPLRMFINQLQSNTQISTWMTQMMTSLLARIRYRFRDPLRLIERETPAESVGDNPRSLDKGCQSAWQHCRRLLA